MRPRPALGEQITFLYSRDLDRADSFYQGKMGFELVLDQGACRIYQSGAGAYLGVCQRREDDQGSVDSTKEGIIFTLVVDDVDGWYRCLQDRGVEIQSPPEESAEFGIYHFFFRDPDGYLLEIQRFLDPAWNKSGG